VYDATTMNPLSQTEAERLLTPHLSDLAAPVYAAWRAWDALTPPARQPLSPRTRANWLYDMTVAHAKATLDRPPTFTYTEQPGFLLVTVEGVVAIRYKKLDDEMGICGIRTRQFQMWGTQAPLPGIEPLTHLVAGYQVSEFGKLQGVVLVCSQGRRVLWHIEAPAAPANLAALPAPAESPEPRVTPVHRRDDAGEGRQG
jgi:hypothetical protein